MSNSGLYQLKSISDKIIIPAGLIILSMLIVWRWPELISYISSPDKQRAFISLLPSVPYAIIPLGVIMGWRYNNTGLILSSAILLFSYSGIHHLSVESDSTVTEAVMFLFPVNIACFSLLSKKQIISATGILCLAVICLQAMAVIFFCSGSIPLQLIPEPVLSIISKETLIVAKDVLIRFLTNHNLFPSGTLTTPAIISIALSVIFLVSRYIIKRDILPAGYAGAVIAASLGLAAHDSLPDVQIYFIASGLILIFTNIEASFFRAYMDDLTGLPGRRSLNETMANLGKKYTIAMMDIDHFKKFNDTYGHKTGDDVLKMVAAKLNEITGGAKTFRYGGEEFTAVFRGKPAEDALPHLEQFRYALENTPFMVRSKTRKKGNKNDRGTGGGKKQVRITVSIGVAEPNKRQNSPEKVIKSADKALYKAKKAGRNCVRT